MHLALGQQIVVQNILEKSFHVPKFLDGEKHIEKAINHSKPRSMRWVRERACINSVRQSEIAKKTSSKIVARQPTPCTRLQSQGRYPLICGKYYRFGTGQESCKFFAAEAPHHVFGAS